MLFNSPQYAVFFITVFLIHWWVKDNRSLRYCFLLACSYFFYMYWNVMYLGLIVFSTVLDYYIGKAIYAEQNVFRKKVLLALSLIGNLGVLGVFKYFNFFTGNANALISFFGMEPVLPALNVLLPVGISFYTFQTLSYTIEIYQGKLEPRTNIIEFALFVSFFPQLVAGPIVRASQFLPQLDEVPKLNDYDLSSGLYHIFKGLFKKIVVADYVGFHLVDPVFADLSSYEGLTILLAVYAFKLQIYCDFSGYSDIAIGSARLLGFELPVNFRSPYKAASFTDYWRRWHLTMGSWFRDFVYFPLGGSKRGQGRAYVNLVITMFLVGLWHGASWTFVFWGLFYAVALCMARFRAQLRKGQPPVEKSLIRTARGFLFTFNVSIIPNILFRAESVSDIGTIFARIFSMSDWTLAVPGSVLLIMIIGYGTHFLPESWKKQSENFFVRAPALAQAFVMLVLVLIFISLHLEENPFYYFQF